MYKLALSDYLLKIKQQYRGQKKALILLELVALISLYTLWGRDNSRNIMFGLWVALIVTQDFRYEKDKRFPDIFSYIPIRQEKKKSYICWRILIEKILFLILGLVSTLIFTILMDGLNVNYFLCIVIAYVILEGVAVKEGFCSLFNSYFYGPYPSELKKWAGICFWICRILDWVMCFVIAFAVVNYMDGTSASIRSVVIPVCVMIPYAVLSILITRYVMRFSMRRLEV